MIFLERTITIVNNNASIDEQVILYKGDRNVEIQFIIKNSPFKYKSGIDTTYGQLIINRKKADSLFSNVSKLSNGKVLFVVTGNMIDELNECGDYDFQIRLFNEAQTSRVTLAPITAGISIREPICEGDDPNTDFISPYELHFNLKTVDKTDYSNLFYNYKGETLDLSSLDTSKVTDMTNIFMSCNNLTEINLSTWDTGNVVKMKSLFQNCYKLKSINISHFNTSNVTDMQQLFYDCESLTTLDLSTWDTSNVTNMRDVFRGCDNLESLNLSSWDMSKVTDASSIFFYDEKLTNLQAPQNISTSISFNSCTKLTHDSLMSIINNLATVTSTQTLTLGSTNLAKLSDDEKAIATNKGWTLK